MSLPDDFDQSAFDAAFAAEFGEPLAGEPSQEDPVTEGPGQEEPTSVIAVVLTPVADAEVLARLMGLVGITWPVFATRTGAVAANHLVAEALSQLTGQVPAEATKVAKVLSRTSEYGVVLLTSRVGSGEDGASGQIHAARFVGGKELETLSPGVVLAGVEDSVEQVLFGTLAPGDVPGALDPAQVARREASKPQPKRRWGRKPR